MPIRMIDMVSKDVHDGAVNYICNMCAGMGNSPYKIRHHPLGCNYGIILNMIRGINAAIEQFNMKENWNAKDILEVTLEETIKE